MSIEENLKSLPSIELKEIDGLIASQLQGLDLIVIDAIELDIEDPFQWIEKLFSKIIYNNGIPIPCLVINKAHNLDLAIDIFEHIRSNWYYDFIHPSHLGSLSIRIANLIKIHDHLHELSRYEKELTSLQKQTDQLQQVLTELLEDKQ
jgi:hypothetical protein